MVGKELGKRGSKQNIYGPDFSLKSGGLRREIVLDEFAFPFLGLVLIELSWFVLLMLAW